MKMILWRGRKMTSEGRLGVKKKMAEGWKSMSNENYQNSWSKVKRMWSLTLCSCGRRSAEVEEERKRQSLTKTKGGRGGWNRKHFLREAGVRLSQKQEKINKNQKKTKNCIPLEAPVCTFTTSRDWLMTARGIGYKLCKLFSFTQRSSHATNSTAK